MLQLELFDEQVCEVQADGKRYLDAYNNVPHVGHSHPAVAEAAVVGAARQIFQLIDERSQLGLLRSGRRCQEITALKIQRRNRLGRDKLLEIDVVITGLPAAIASSRRLFRPPS